MRHMGQFCWFLNEDALKEVHLKGRLFPWTNERLHPTLKCIDRAFITSEWEGFYPHYDLHSLSSLYLDHTPFLLRMDNLFRYRKRFHFRSFWPCFQVFLDVMQRAWH
jgi:hypothetical protein